MLGHSLVRAGRFNDAEAVFKRSLAIDAPVAETSSAHFGLGDVAKKTGRRCRVRAPGRPAAP